MIAAIEGEIVVKEPNYCDIMTASGVAYRLFISLNTYAALDKPRVRLLTSLILREDSMTLYGFTSEAERGLFEALIKVSGVGPKSAMAILSTFTPAQFAEAIANGDERLLTRAPGVGKKSAGLIILQLGGALDKIRASGDSASFKAAQALETLGFNSREIAQALAKCVSGDVPTLVKEALKLLKKP
ncbi:MAG: Holliday junction branch migration protein RuvA [Helicobacteraceae bacterium]|jgi:Holliday junction DNA helicase RuvA|nr:Holliday junction branch migration protein RuvA [Helicobacteraceae bacterium]